MGIDQGGEQDALRGVEHARSASTSAIGLSLAAVQAQKAPISADC